MNGQVLAALWILVSLDCALMGYRLAMGRSALLDKRRYHQRRSLRAAAVGQPALAAVTLLTACLVTAGPEGIDGAFNAAMVRVLAVALPYAACILATTAVCILPSVSARTAASIVIFGPFTLVRPVVVIGAVLYAVLPDPRWQLVLVGLIVAAPGVLLEPSIDRRISTNLLRRA